MLILTFDDAPREELKDKSYDFSRGLERKDHPEIFYVGTRTKKKKLSILLFYLSLPNV
jgi:hypothetical protein